MKNYCFSRIIRIIFSVTIAAQILQGCKPDSNVQSEVRKFYSLESQKVILKHMSSKLSDHELRELWTKAEIERLTEIKRFDKEKITITRTVLKLSKNVKI